MKPSPSVSHRFVTARAPRPSRTPRRLLLLAVRLLPVPLLAAAMLLPSLSSAQTTPAPSATPPAGDANIAAYKAAQDGAKAPAQSADAQPADPPPADAASKPEARDAAAAQDSATPSAPPPAGDANIEAVKAAQAGQATEPTPAAPTGAVPAKRDTLSAQILLERAHFSPGEIDGQGGANTRRAIAAYQRSQGLTESGELDEATWTALEALGPALVDYTISAQDVAGPFAQVPDDMMEKSKLSTLGYASATEALAEKFRSSPALLQRLNPGKSLDVAGTALTVPNLAGLAAPPKAAKVVVDKSDSSVALIDAAGRTYARFPASTGSEHDPLPVGEWKINGVSVDPAFHYNPELFWDADPAHSKARIPPGPNNPVGVAWVDLSKPHYGIHGTPEPQTIGKTQSHGCIRLTNWSARELAQAVTAGTPALLQE